MIIQKLLKQIDNNKSNRFRSVRYSVIFNLVAQLFTDFHRVRLYCTETKNTIKVNLTFLN